MTGPRLKKLERPGEFDRLARHRKIATGGRRGCDIEGCRRAHSARGLCNAHYQIFMKYVPWVERSSRKEKHTIRSIYNLPED